METRQRRRDHEVGAFADGLVAGFHLDRVIRLHLALRQPAPKQRGSIPKEARARHAEPEQHQRRDNRGGRKAENDGRLRDLARLGLLRDGEGILGQQFEEWILRPIFGAFRERQQAFLKLRILALHLTRGMAAIQADYRHDQRGCQCEGQSEKQEYARPQNASAGKSELVCEQHRHNGEEQRRRCRHCRPTRQCNEAQTTLDGAQVIGQAIQRFHAASLSTDRC